MYSLILHGRRSLELQKWLNFRVSANLLPNLSALSNSFSSAIAQDGRKGKTFTVSYLVSSLGFTKNLAKRISRKVSFEEKGKPDSVLSFFRSHGFTDCQISAIIMDYPQLLVVADAEKSIAPKLQFLQSRGASASEVSEILSKVPRLLGMNEEKSISVYYDFAKEVVEADKSCRYKRLCHSSLQEGSKHENILRNVSVLREVGVPQRLLLSLLTSEFQFVCGKEKFQESLIKVLRMGISPTTSSFVAALRLAYDCNETTIEEKVCVYKRLGFAVGDVREMFKKWPMSMRHSEKKITQTFETFKKCGLHEDDICSVVIKYPQCMGVSEQSILNSVETFVGLGFSRDQFAMIVKRHPQCIGYSVETVKKKIEFVVKQMNWSLKAAVVSSPAVLGCSLEKRIVPRCNVIKALMSKGLLGSELPPLSPVLAITNEAFLNKYVRMHDDNELVAELMAIFTGNKDGKIEHK